MLTQIQNTSTRKGFLWGILMLIIANICFSAKAVIIKLLYKEGITTESVIALRMIIALPFYLGTIVWLGRREQNVRLTMREWLAISGLGILSYYISSMLDFMGLQYVTAGVERLILYTYPTMVLVFSALLFKQKVTRTQIFALVITYTGVILAFVAEKGLGVQRDLIKGGLLIFTCAITYSVYVVYTGQYARKVGSAKFTSYAVIAATVPAIIQSWWCEGLDLFHFSGEVYWLGIWLGVVATVVPTFLIVEGIRVIGANNSGIVGFVGPVSTIVLANIFLGEAITPLQLVGTVVVLGGVFLLTTRS